MGCGTSSRSAWAVASGWLVCCLLLTLAAAPAGAGQGEIGSHEPGPRPVPVILVPGLEGRSERTWGSSPWPGQRGTGLLGHLAGLGYEEGRDVFTLDYSRVPEPDLVRLAARELAWRVDWVLDRTGSDRVDLVGYGYGGLICRYYLRLAEAAGRVRTLVMIATPNQGAFSAHLLRVAAEQARQEPWPAVPAVSPAPAVLPAFQGSAAYVDQRAVVYGSLYGEYRTESELLRGPGQGPGRDFPEWLATARSDLYRAWFLEAQLPPRQGPASLDTPPREGEALTVAYYEFLAMQVGCHNYLKAATRRTVTLTPPPVSILRSPDLWGAILDYLKTVVVDYLYQRGKAYLEENQTRLAMQVLSWVLPVETDGVAVERLLPERVRYPAGPDAVGRPTYHALTANHFLSGWNRDEDDPALRDTRYVLIAGRTLNLAGQLWRGVTDNDLVVELESTLVPLGDDDRLIVVSGLWRGTHLAFLWDARVHQAVADALAISRPVSHWLDLPATPRAWTRNGRGTADAWRPTYLRVTGPEDGAGRVVVTVTAERERVAARDGLAYHLWAHAVAPDGSVTATWRATFSQQGPVPRAELDLPAPGPHQLMVGVRLAPVARPGEIYLTGQEETLAGPCRDPWASALLGAGGKALPFSYEVTWQPVAAGPGFSALPESRPPDPVPGPPVTPAPAAKETALPSAAPQPDGRESSPLPPASPPPPTPASPEPPPAVPGSPQPDSRPASSSSTASANPSPPPGPSGPLPAPADIRGLREVSGQTANPPRIEVKTVRRLITQKKESRTYHVRWEWELGDGRRVVEEDPGRLVSTLTPAYPAAGTYQVRAFSFSNQGQILREQRWKVSIPPGASPDQPGKGSALRAETIAEPRVVVALDGPAAWVTGRPARFTVRAWTADPLHGRITEVKADPGWAFDVVWERPGTYAVAAAVSVKVSYSLGDRSLTITNTYLHGVKVDVAAAVVSQ